jgi:EAL domain-containing protein (putative c-di-GMP-specific phosphodiesterase class I)/GGDEF domain-containing protein/PAS domain-containing protein
LTDNPAVPLIVFSPQREPSEFINGLMRKAGEPVHCTWIPAVRDLGEALEQLNPELLICAYVSDADAKQAATIRDQLAPQVPMLLVRPQISENDIATGMRIGARDVISLSASDRVQAVVARELRSFRLERALNTTLQSASDYRRQLQSVLQRSNDAILQVQEGIVVDANATILELFGYADETAVVGQPLMDLFEERSHAALKGALVACSQGRWSDHPLKVNALLADSTHLLLDLVLTPGEYDNDPCVRIMVPARKRDEKQLTTDLNDAVKRDATTGLLLRRPLLDAIGARIAAPPAAGVRFMALVRPDKFAELEKDVGVRASEQLVGEYATLLKSYLGPNDIAGRFAGVSFLALIERGNSHDVEAWAESVLQRFSETASTVGQRTVHSSCTVGITAVPTAGASVDAVVADVVEAVKRARSQGGNQIFHLDKADTDTRVQAYDRIWVKHIKSALMENRFRLVQQPVASLQGDDPNMFDVLVRMLDNQGKEVLPAEFMAAAERNDLLKNIDRWVVGASLSFAAQKKPGCLFVRLSRDSVLDNTFTDWLKTQLATGTHTPARICFQITESIAEQYMSAALNQLGTLKKMGFRLALERFGSGRDPIKLLSSVPLDFIKIDGALVQDLAANFETQAAVKKLVEQAVKLKIETIAERVEDANTMAVLWQLGVQFIQGYFVNAPEEVTITDTQTLRTLSSTPAAPASARPNPR